VKALPLSLFAFSTANLRALGRFAALVFAVTCAVSLPLLMDRYAIRGDIHFFTDAGQGNMHTYFFPNWALPFFQLLAWLPEPGAHIAINLMNVAGLYYASAVFGGNRTRLWLSYPLLALLWYGNVDGVIGAGIAWMYSSVGRQQWWLAGLAWTLILTKPQLGLAVGLPLLLRAGVKWNAWPVLAVPALISLASLVIWPLWPLDLLGRLQAAPPDSEGSITLWRYIGPLALLFWLPVMRAGRLPPRKHLLLSLSATALSMPYLQSSSALYLLVHPIGVVGCLVQLGFLMPLLGIKALRLLTVVPLLIYAQLVMAGLGAGPRLRGETDAVSAS
jgi:hypothetical protein